ncbi:MAG: hypothetical protein KME27_26105 [Lyngbya sp. HA4199-MV5]|jgi:hypothetical protein|nr:hypothetical protein [Lyngbya sp. HA4199-MV5]
MNDELETWVPTGVRLVAAPIDSIVRFASSSHYSSKVQSLAVSLSHEGFA